MEDKLIKTLRLMILGLLTICSLLCQAQEDKAKMDRFHKLCKAGRYLEMSQVFSNHDSISPYTNLYSKVYSAIANNQNWLAISLIDDNLRYNWKAYSGDVINLSTILIKLYLEEGMYEKMASHLVWLKEEYYPSQLVYYNDKQFTSVVMSQISELEKQLKQKVLITPVYAIRKGDEQIIKFKIDPFIKTQININGTPIETLWTTYSKFAMTITHSVADQLGLVCGQDSAYGCPIVYLDSISIGNVRFYHVPTFVADVKDPTPYFIKHKLSRRKIRKIREFCAKNNTPQIGLPIIKQLERVAIDWKNQRISFPTDSLPQADMEERMYFAPIRYPELYMPISINTNKAIGQVGLVNGDYIDLSKDFFQKYHFPSTKMKGKGYTLLTENGINDSVNIVLLSPSLIVGRQKIVPKEEVLVTPSKNPSCDVQLGLPFFKSLGQTVVFDFKKMKIQIWKKSFMLK